MSGDQLDILLKILSRIEDQVSSISEKLEDSNSRVAVLETKVSSIRNVFKYIGSLGVALVGSLAYMASKFFVDGGK